MQCVGRQLNSLDAENEREGKRWMQKKLPNTSNVQQPKDVPAKQLL